MWQDYKTLVGQHSVVGDLRLAKEVYSPQFNNKRTVLVWLPPDYATSTRGYPVLYMHDGQNLFDAYTSFSGEWGVDETLTALSAEGLSAIVVGIHNYADQRRIEYNPYTVKMRHRTWHGRGDDYIRFITDTLKPLIDKDFRTLPQAETTGIAGSSMGGLISLHGFLTRQDVFGFCGSFSPVCWIGKGLQDTLDYWAQGKGKVYLDIGGKEGEVVTSLGPKSVKSNEAGNRYYVEGVRDLQGRLLARGYRTGENLMYVEEADAHHNEKAWARRLPDALRFLLPRL
jgi:predicted alpha/beta superfamily hydrolase